MATSGSSSYPLGSSNYDMQSQFTSGSASDYSRVGNIQAALKVPLGSQLALLSAQNAGNPYLNYGGTGFEKLGSLQNALTGYNTLGQNLQSGQYFTFGNAYGKY